LPLHENKHNGGITGIPSLGFSMNHDRDFEESDVTGLGALQESCSEKFMPQKMFLPDALSWMPYATLQHLCIPCCRATTRH
jgi:hypothetical protein